MSWFTDARLGMFIHFGVYSHIGRGEWAANRERIPFEEYKKYAEEFKAENYCPEEWAKLAKKAGMKYMVLTTRHHDGFALFDSKVNSFNSVNIGPKRDIVREYAEAARAEGLKVGFYYSPANWFHPDYPSAYMRDWPLAWDDEEKRKRYVEYYKSELCELLTNYGKVDLLWYDGCIPKPLDGDEVNEMVRRLQPGIVINNRNGKNCDYICCEQTIVVPKEDVAWEACMTLNDNWGYHYDDENYKSFHEVIKMIIKVSQGGGNLLLNVGPKPDGTIPEKSIEILEKVGEWMDCNKEAIYRSEKNAYSWYTGKSFTKKGNTVYMHVFHGSKDECIAEFKNKVISVRRLLDNKNIDFRQDGERLFINTGMSTVAEYGAVVYEIKLDGEPEVITKRTSFWIPGVEE